MLTSLTTTLTDAYNRLETGRCAALVSGAANVVFVVLTFFMAGFPPALFGRFIHVVILTFFATDGLMAWFAIMASSHQMANAFSGTVLGVLSLFNGFTANRLNMPVWQGGSSNQALDRRWIGEPSPHVCISIHPACKACGHFRSRFESLF